MVSIPVSLRAVVAALMVAISAATVPVLALAEAPVDATRVSNPSRITVEQLDALVAAELKTPLAATVEDEQFLRRLSLDLIGRQPLPEELSVFMSDASPDRRSRAVDRLLAHPEFGKNWADYWTDTIAFRVPPPELTFLDYGPFKSWLAAQLNDNTPWDETIRAILSATGKVKDNPPVTFVAYHGAHSQRLASETARIFLSLQIGCAQCHDHPFDEWKREQFHELAAYFVRASVKFPHNEGAETEVKDKGKGEYEMPNVMDPTKKGVEMMPAFLSGEKMPKGKPDVERRKELAGVIASSDNPWFAKAYVNRVWARMLGRGFFEPVDDFGPAITPVLEPVHAVLAEEFRASGHDVKALFRLIANSRTYQQRLPTGSSSEDHPFIAANTGKLRGDEVFASLVTAIDLPNVTPPKVAPTKEIRFPPPPKSTRDIVAEAFAYDPSTRVQEVSRTLQQAMLLMNNDQLQKQVNADPQAGTVLSKLLAEQSDNAAAVEQLFLTVLARKPTAKEQTMALEHVSSVPARGAAFEDLLWSLLNTTEFTTKR